MTKSEIQLIRSLSDKRSREENGLFVAEGDKLVQEFMASDFVIKNIYRVGENASPKDMERSSHLSTPTSILALVEIPRRSLDPAALKSQLTLALDGVQNPGNLGTIIRLADWFGIRTILASSDTADCFNPKVVQATMGSLTRVALHYGNLPAIIEQIEAVEEACFRAPLPIYGTFLSGTNLYTTPLSKSGIIILGNEGRGISPQVEKLVTQRLFIPSCHIDAKSSLSDYPSGSPAGHAPESLNVALAAAIICSEFRRPPNN
ncbi:MAG: RNA methyltransferase [Alistipes sp.]|jgi:TrmH family RNA methyltransferase|nr:RNA methyltransferase [Alistipes sp.]